MKWYGFSFKRRHDETGPLLWGNQITTFSLGLFKIEWVVMAGPIKPFVRWIGINK